MEALRRARHRGRGHRGWQRLKGQWRYNADVDHMQGWRRGLAGVCHQRTVIVICSRQAVGCGWRSWSTSLSFDQLAVVGADLVPDQAHVGNDAKLGEEACEKGDGSNDTAPPGTRRKCLTMERRAAHTDGIPLDGPPCNR